MRRYKVVIAKSGLDGHERGAHAVTAMLRDAGMEVVYLGMFQPAERIVRVALDEDADIIGLSALNGEHIVFTKQVLDVMAENEMDDVLLLVGGIIPVEDIPTLHEIGVHGVFPAGTMMREISSFIEDNARARRDPIGS